MTATDSLSALATEYDIAISKTHDGPWRCIVTPPDASPLEARIGTRVYEGTTLTEAVTAAWAAHGYD